MINAETNAIYYINDLEFRQTIEVTVPIDTKLFTLVNSKGIIKSSEKTSPTWQMQFSVNKCEVTQIGTSKYINLICVLVPPELAMNGYERDLRAPMDSLMKYQPRR